MNRLLKIVLAVYLLTTFSCQNDIFSSNRSKSALRLKSHIDTVSYSLGINIARRLEQEGMGQINVDIMSEAIKQVLSGTADDSLLIHPAVADQILKLYLYKERKRMPSISVSEKQNWKEFLEKNAKLPGIKVMRSGIQYQILRPGKGQRPRLSDYVEVRYKGYLPDGTVFDQNYMRTPALFRVSSAIEGWQQVLVRMREGAYWRVFIPPYLAFGSRGAGKVPPNSVVIYDIELLKIKHIK